MTLSELGDRVSHFYERPTPEEFLLLQNESDAHSKELLDAKNNAGLLFSVFISRASEKTGMKIAGKGAICGLASELAKGGPGAGAFVRDDSRVNPTKLDIWWVSYFATGDEAYLEDLMRYAGREIPKGDVNEMFVVSTATWSFKSNCKQHDSVRRFAGKCLLSGKYEDRRAFLLECAGPQAGSGGPQRPPDRAPAWAAPGAS